MSGTCRHCGSSATREGQPSRRQFYACGSYDYEGGNGYQTDLCFTSAELATVTAERNELHRLLQAASAALAVTATERDAARAELAAVRAAVASALAPLRTEDRR